MDGQLLFMLLVSSNTKSGDNKMEMGNMGTPKREASESIGY